MAASRPSERPRRTPGGRDTAEASHTTSGSFAGWWIVLFPVTYLVHIAEEYWGGFTGRMSDLTGLAFPEVAFLAANAVFWLLMTAVAVWIIRRPSHAALAVALATIVTINATLHLGVTLATLSYSPGLVSGMLLWLPLGVSTLVRGHRTLSRRSFRAGLLAGVIAHVLVPIVGVTFAAALGGG